jgi:putative membrane protein
MLPGWHPHPDVWLLIVGLEGGYLFALARFRQRYSSLREPTSLRYPLLFTLGVFAIWLALDWPIHELADNYLYSAHTVQHMLLTLVGPPLLLAGTPPWMLRMILGRGLLLNLARRLTRPMVALIIFNGVIAAIHWPVLVEAMVSSFFIHVSIHLVLIGSALLMWTPVLSPLLELPQLSYPARMFYLFLQSLVPTVPASFLTFAQHPLYAFYEAAPRIYSLSALDDLRISGLIMKIGGGFILWGLILVLFFRWHAVEQTEGVDVLAWQDVDQELSRMRLDWEDGRADA